MPRQLYMQVHLMPTALVKIILNNKVIGMHRALSDTGATPNLIRLNLIKKWLAHTRPANFGVVGIADSTVRIKRKIELCIQPWFSDKESDKIKVTFWVLPASCGWSAVYPDQNISPDAIEQKLSAPLANPYFWQSGEVPILLGIDVLAQIMEGEVHRVGKRIVQQNTTFGHLIYGRTDSSDKHAKTNQLEQKQSVLAIDFNQIDQTVQKFWQFEDLSLCTKKDAENELVESMFKKTHYREKSGRHVVTIPIQPNVNELGSSREAALRRFMLQEKKFERDATYKQKYIEFMDTMLELGHMREAKEQPKAGEMVYYIPHHGIMSGKSFRVVFDASCKTKLGKSLNDIQFTGPKLQRDLFDILMRFRRHKIAFTADIKKMFRQIGVIEQQWNLQRIFWRSDPKAPLKEYQIVTVIYGLKSSPYLAVQAMLTGANEMRSQYPDAVQIIHDDFYMDDCASGAENEGRAVKVATELRTVLKRSKFELCEWRSNSQRFVNELQGNNETPVSFDEADQTSILGLKWLPKTDQWTFAVKKVDESKPITKRTILSRITQLFDPEGFIAPLIVQAKLLVQQLWIAKLTWDQPVPIEIEKNWRSFWSSIKKVEQIRIPRWLGMETGVQVQLHGFADSSGHAMGCCVYLRAIDAKGNIMCNLVASKSRIAPLKEVTIPRKELAAATLLSQLMFKVRSSLELTHVPYFMWCDSTIALHWINKPLHALKLYVANRVKEILKNSQVQNWNHVRTKQNPADLVSRGLAAEELIASKLWWNGPKWLQCKQEQWPKPLEIPLDISIDDVQVELKVHAVRPATEFMIFVEENGNSAAKTVPLIEYSQNIGEIKRVLAYVLRFIQILRNRRITRVGKPMRKIKVDQLKKGQLRKLIDPPTDEEKRLASHVIFRQEQAKSYPREVKYLHEHKLPDCQSQFPEKSKILNLRPFMDSDGILRAGGRIGDSDLPYDTKYPVIIEHNTPLSKLLIRNAHNETRHGAVQSMIQYLRNSFWIPRVRSEAHAHYSKCTECKKYRNEFGKQLMANLPADRITKGYPFEATGVDYAGPFDLAEVYGRKTNLRKCWVSIFVCMKTRAVHIDIVKDLTSAAFINCYERFVSRRGPCLRLYSDNATTFVGANKELKAAFKAWYTPQTFEHVRARTTWKFMKPGASHHGGIYEAAVKIAKHHIKRVMGAKHYVYDDFLTFLLKVEAILNSRPLYALSDDPSDVQAVTPGHALIGRPFVVPPPIAAPKKSNYSVIRVREEHDKMLQSFWKSWSTDYLSSLLPRKKWCKAVENIEVGQMVLVKDENLPPSKWLMGVVCEVLPSTDGFVRSVKIRTNNKAILTRAVQKLCLLPAKSELEKEEAERAKNSDENENKQLSDSAEPTVSSQTETDEQLE